MQKEIGWAVRSRELAVRSITKSLGTATFIEQLFFRPFFLASFGKRAPETALRARALRTPGLLRFGRIRPPDRRPGSPGPKTVEKTFRTPLSAHKGAPKWLKMAIYCYH